MTNLPASLSIALWIIVAVWLLAGLALAFDLPGEFVWAPFIIGLFTGVVEWLAGKRKDNR